MAVLVGFSVGFGRGAGIPPHLVFLLAIGGLLVLVVPPVAILRTLSARRRRHAFLQDEAVAQERWRAVEAEGATCLHCGIAGKAETDFRFSRATDEGGRSVVICRHCGWPQGVPLSAP